MTVPTPRPPRSARARKDIQKYLLSNEGAVIITRRHWAVLLEPAVKFLQVFASGVLLLVLDPTNRLTSAVGLRVLVGALLYLGRPVRTRRSATSRTCRTPNAGTRRSARCCSRRTSGPVGTTRATRSPRRSAGVHRGSAPGVAAGGRTRSRSPACLPRRDDTDLTRWTAPR